MEENKHIHLQLVCPCAFYCAVLTAKLRSISASSPSFTIPPAGGASLSIPENQAVDSIIYTVAATDADGDGLTYRIKSSSPSSGSSKFSVTTPGGKLKVASALDYESQTSYTLTFG